MSNRYPVSTLKPEESIFLAGLRIIEKAEGKERKFFLPISPVFPLPI